MNTPVPLPANASSGGSKVVVECPYPEVIGQHQVELTEPIIDDAIGTCPMCQEQYRVHKGPPVTLSKV